MNNRWPFAEVLDAARYYVDKSGRLLSRWLRWCRREVGAGPQPRLESHNGPSSAASGELTPIWSLVANVVAERAYGSGGSEVRAGTKVFRPNAKVYVVNGYPGTGMEVVTAIGRGRGRSPRLVRADMPTKHLTNWRVRLVYSPAVLRRITDPDIRFLGSLIADESPDPGSAEYRKRLERLAAVWPSAHGEAASRPVSTSPSTADVRPWVGPSVTTC